MSCPGDDLNPLGKVASNIHLGIPVVLEDGLSCSGLTVCIETGGDFDSTVVED